MSWDLSRESPGGFPTQEPSPSRLPPHPLESHHCNYLLKVAPAPTRQVVPFPGTSPPPRYATGSQKMFLLAKTSIHILCRHTSFYRLWFVDIMIQLRRDGAQKKLGTP